MGRWLLSLLAAAAFACGTASAQPFPNKPIRVIIGFAAGGPADVMARLVAQRMPQILGQPFIIENRPGAGGSIAAKFVAESDPDGYTLLLGNTSNQVISPALYSNVGYDPAKAFAPVAMLGSTSNLLVVNPNFAAKSVKDIVAMAKEKPGKLNYSSPGVGTPPHLNGEMFKLRAGIDMVHVPYKGGGHSSQAVIAGDVEMTFENPAVSLPYVQGGRLRALAVTNDTRNRQAPDIPTMVEAGVPDFVSVSFTGIVAPAGTPSSVIARLNAAVVESMKSPEVQSALDKLGVDTRAGTPEEFASFLAREREKWGALIRAANIKPE